MEFLEVLVEAWEYVNPNAAEVGILVLLALGLGMFILVRHWYSRARIE